MIHIPGSSHVLLSTVKAAYKTYFYKVTDYMYPIATLKSVHSAARNAN
jgi:hypothetical protein